MDQRKIGAYLKELRQNKKMTQQELAEKLGVSNRSVSRWETGATMPDFDLLIELARFYDVGVDAILDGGETASVVAGHERCETSINKSQEEDMDKETEALLTKIAEYENTGLATYSKRMMAMFIVAVGCMGVFAAIDIAGLWDTYPYEAIANIALGFILGTLLTGIIYSSGKLARIKAAKRRLLKAR